MDQIVRTPKQVGEVLRRHRRQHAVTQTTLASQAGVRPATISDLENGERGARMDTLFDVLAALDLEIVIRPRSKASSADIEKIF